VNRFAAVFVMASLVSAGTGVWAAPPTTRPTPGAAARAEQLKAAVASFGLTLAYHGEQDQPYYGLTLTVHEGVVGRRDDPFHPVETVTKEQAGRVIDHLAVEGFLDHAIEVGDKEIPAPPAPCYTMTLLSEDESGRHELYEVLGWGLPLLGRLDGLRGVLDGGAAEAMDRLLGRMSGHRREWEKAEAADPIGRLVARLSADPMWQNGISPVIDLPPTAPTEQVVSKVFGPEKRHKTVKEREVHVPGGTPDRYTAALVETDLGEKVVLLQHQGRGVGWWSRVYDAERPKAAAEPDAKAADGGPK
jgi:hypothetical protein